MELKVVCDHPTVRNFKKIVSGTHKMNASPLQKIRLDAQASFSDSDALEWAAASLVAFRVSLPESVSSKCRT